MDVLLLSYNNKTYRIDDIDWNATPRSEFTKGDREKTQISYLDYYQQVTHRAHVSWKFLKSCVFLLSDFKAFKSSDKYLGP